MRNIRIVDPYNPFYKAVLARAEVIGATVPSANCQSLDNGFLNKICRNGDFFEHDRIWMFATDGDRAFAKINWRNPGTGDATEVGTPDFHSASGFSANTTSNYVRLNYTATSAGVKFLRLNNSFYVHVTSPGDGYVFGGYEATPPAGGIFLNLRTSPSVHGWGNWCGELAWPAAYADNSGGYQIVRDSDSNTNLHYNGSSVGTNAGGTTRDVAVSLFATLYNRDAVPTTPNNNAHVGCIALGSENVSATFHNYVQYRFDRL